MLRAALLAFALTGAAQAETLTGVHLLFNNPQHGETLDGYKRHLDDAARMGAEVIRYPGDWRGLEPEAAQYSTQYIEQTIALLDYADALGLKVIMLMAQTPHWALPKGVPEHDLWTPPADPKQFAAALVHLARAIDLAGQGRSIIAWEIWNEPNAMPFWQGADLRDVTYVLVETQHSHDYVALLNASYNALKSYDTDITVLGGSVAGGDIDYIEMMFQAGARYDALSIHPYARVNEATGLSWGPRETSQNALDQIWAFETGVKRVRALMLSHGDTRDIWITEFGWSSSADWGGAGSTAVQAGYTRTALELIETWAFVPVAILYRLYDDEEEMGLLQVNGDELPVGTMFREFMGRH